jgi:hypothetical protein
MSFHNSILDQVGLEILDMTTKLLMVNEVAKDTSAFPYFNPAKPKSAFLARGCGGFSTFRHCAWKTVERSEYTQPIKSRTTISTSFPLFLWSYKNTRCKNLQAIRNCALALLLVLEI